MEFGKFQSRLLVCDLLWLNSIMLSRLQTWLQTWFRPVADRFELSQHVEIARTWSHTGSGHIPLRYLAR